MSGSPKIVVVGLGYVGLPLAVALARNYEVIGFDRDRSRIAELKEGVDRTREVDDAELASARLRLTAQSDDCAGADVYILSVPTPVDETNRPDLSAVMTATQMVAALIDPKRCPTIVYEST